MAGVPYSFIPVVTGGSGALSFALTSGSLTGTGLSFNTTTGEVSGTPTGAVTVTGLAITVTDALGATAVLSGLSIIVSAFLNARYVDTTAGNDTTGAGTELSPYATLTKALNAVLPDTAIFIKNGSLIASPVVLPNVNNLMLSKYGSSGSIPKISGNVSIKGGTGNWTEVGTDGVTATVGSLRWRRAFTNADSSKYILIANGSFTSWRRETPADVVVDPTGREIYWYLGTDHLIVYAPSNPATFYSSLEVNSVGVGLDATACPKHRIEGIEVVGWTAGINHGPDATIHSTYVHLCATYGHQFAKGGKARGGYDFVAGVSKRNIVYDVGSETVLDTNDVNSNGMVFPGEDNANYTYDAELWDTVIDNTRDDVVHTGGTSNGINKAASVFWFKSSVPGRTRFTRSGHDENIVDNQAGKIYLEGAYVSQNDDPNNALVAKHSAFHCYGYGNHARDTIINARNTGPEGYYYYGRRGDGYLEAINSVLVGLGSAGPMNILDQGKTSRLIGCFAYSAGSTSNIRHVGGNVELLASTILGGVASVAPQRLIQSIWSAITFVSRSANPDENDNHTYTCTSNNATAWMITGARYEIVTLSGASAALNRVITIKSHTENVGGINTFTFDVPASANPPATVDKTGGSLYSLPKVSRMAGNLFAASGSVLSFPKSAMLEGLINEPNAIHDVTGSDAAVRIYWDKIGGILNEDGVARVHTSPQTMAQPGAAGDLYYNSNGQLGGSAWKAENTSSNTNPLKTWSVSSITVLNGIATVVCNGHPFTAPGQKAWIMGSAPNNLNHGQFIESVIDANTFTFVAEREVLNQTASGTITVSDFSARAGATSLASAPTVDISAYTTKDIQGRTLASSGRNFGASQAA